MEKRSKTTLRLKDQVEALVSEMSEKGILLSEALDQFEKRFIQQSLALHNGNITRTAMAIGIHRNTLSKKIERYEL